MRLNQVKEVFKPELVIEASKVVLWGLRELGTYSKKSSLLLNLCTSFNVSESSVLNSSRDLMIETCLLPVRLTVWLSDNACLTVAAYRAFFDQGSTVF